MPSAPISLSRAVLASIYEHARATYPQECCGYVAGADTLVRCTNAQASGDNPVAPERTAETGFVISGRELFEFATAFHTASPPRVVYHSHTNGRAYFSEVDHAIAATDGGPAYPVQHLVVGVTADAITECAQFAWSDADARYVECARWRPE